MGAGCNIFPRVIHRKLVYRQCMRLGLVRRQRIAVRIENMDHSPMASEDDKLCVDGNSTGSVLLQNLFQVAGQPFVLELRFHFIVAVVFTLRFYVKLEVL